MLILVRQIQRIADFVEYNGVETSHLVIELKLVNCKILEKKGKQIDKENYSKDCFGIEFNYIHSTKELCILDNGLYYVDNNGDKHYLEVDKLHIGNIMRSTIFEYNRFLKNKKKYLEENTNVLYELV